MSTPGTATVNGAPSAISVFGGRLSAFASEGFPWAPIVILTTILLVAIFANAIAPYNPEVGTLGDRFKPPAWQTGGSMAHWLGTDHLGRDIMSRLMFGARV